MLINMSIDLNTTLDNIKYKLNTIFNSEKFAHELKNKAFRDVLFKQIAAYKYLATKAENSSQNLEYVDVALERLNHHSSDKRTADELATYTEIDDAMDDIRYLDIFILNTFNLSFDEIVKDDKTPDKNTDSKSSVENKVEAATPTVSDIEEDEIKPNRSIPFNGGINSPINLKDNLEKIFTTIGQPDYRQFASIVVKSELDIGKIFLYKEKLKLMPLLNYFAFVISLLFALLGASLMIWYFVLFQRQAIPTFVSQFDKNSYPIFATPNFISAAVLIAVSVVTSISYINSATGKTPPKRAHNAVALISTYMNKEVKVPQINDNLKYSFKIRPLVLFILFLLVYSFSPFLTPFAGGSLLQGIISLYSVPARIDFVTNATITPEIVSKITEVIWISLMTLPLAILFLIVVSFFFKPKIDNERLEETINKYAEEIKKATGEITSLFDRGSTTDTSKSGVF
ncbi:hypothetical protein BAX51_01855 [Mycoplasmoides gallisepticum]|uniref:Uncharacterized protein n=3 Tax=Mycoplasmoides gallisepticum TaxID=2096 RepID=A0AB36DTK5_MYCGL|nr:hypothetical protein BAY37_03600 [Mycoplasmoides gallisepticum]OBU78961.1 hypothetical protein BAY36_00725 [Mycoplasmoides gallisepticum]OBU79576.1 hypothetical protein BAX52_03955 [Mycoplasmoides gallisepticum]OBU79588.1 hypothetical protein BAX53_03815 [Mycoplasmoides gallisepticum]OBU80798.1 hypothetical protein BAX51_01855 [Mycoplasmoides gallisepticum]